MHTLILPVPLSATLSVKKARALWGQGGGEKPGNAPKVETEAATSKCRNRKSDKEVSRMMCVTEG